MELSLVLDDFYFFLHFISKEMFFEFKMIQFDKSFGIGSIFHYKEFLSCYLY